MVTRRWMIAGLVAAAGTARADAPLSSPRPVVRPAIVVAPLFLRGAGERLVAEAALGGQVGYLAVDLADGTVIDSRRAALALPPASTAKVMTALYALDRLGPGHRFATQVLATGPVEGGTVQGDLILRGAGDPTLQTDGLAEIAAALRARGVTGVSGRFFVDDLALPGLPLIDPGQPHHVGYNPAISGLNLNFNRVHFEWRRAAAGWNVAMDARSERVVPAVGMARMTVVTREDPLFTFDGTGGVDRWTVASGALGDGGGRWLPVRLPALYAGDVFRTLARAQGTVLPEAERSGLRVAGTVLVDRPSDALTDVLGDMLRYSTNLTAEVAGLTASGAARLADSGRAMSAWAAARFGQAGAFVDHSGLGDASRAAPADMVAALVGAHDGPLPGILKPFVPRDARGREQRSHPVRITAKTGTLNFCSGLVGYATAPSGRRIAFSIFAADVPRRRAVPVAEREDPPGAAVWAKRARHLQSRLIERWAGVGA